MPRSRVAFGTLVLVDFWFQGGKCYSFRDGTTDTDMILPKALALGLQLMVPVAGHNDEVPKLNVEQVCEGIAKQGGVTFHDPAIAQEKKNCLDSEQAIRDETSCQTMGGLLTRRQNPLRGRMVMVAKIQLHRTSDLPGNGADVRAMRAEQEGAASSPVSNPMRQTKQAPHRHHEAPAVEFNTPREFTDGRVYRTQRDVGGVKLAIASHALIAAAEAVDAARKLIPTLQPPAGEASVPPFQLLNVATLFLSKPESLNGLPLRCSNSASVNPRRSPPGPVLPTFH